MEKTLFDESDLHLEAEEDVVADICTRNTTVNNSLQADITESDFADSDSLLRDGGSHQARVISERICSDKPSTDRLLKYSYIPDWFRMPGLSCRSRGFDVDNYFKGCKWSPDGSRLVAGNSDQSLRVFGLHSKFYGHSDVDNEIQSSEVTNVDAELKIQESSLIYDFCWYPLTNSQDSSTGTCCLASTSRGSPIHMWDANSGELKCSYLAYNHLDELVAAQSLCFSCDGAKLLSGFNKRIRVFDVRSPGRRCSDRLTFNKEGQSGIISCIAVSHKEPNVYAAGSYTKTIALYHEPVGEMVCMFQGHQGGITHLLFSPDGTKLYSGGRKDFEILCWDLRKPGHILFSALRNVRTNQRIYFHLDDTGKCLMSGNHDGTVTVWDTTAPPRVAVSGSEPVLPVKLQFKAHDDTVNGLSIHPTLPVVATTSGQRHYRNSDVHLSVSDSSDGSDNEIFDSTSTMENTLKIWTFPEYGDDIAGSIV